VTRRLLLRVVAALGALALALAAAGCGEEEPAPAAGEAPEATDACAAGELPQLQAGTHLLGDTPPPVPYSSTPATSGWHLSGAFSTGVIDRPIDDPHVVAILERGGVAALYDPTQAGEDEVAELVALAEGPYTGRLSVAPYDGELGSPVALVAWGVLQRCDAVDGDAVATFVLRYHGAVESH
jgi:hypothetical protein